MKYGVHEDSANSIKRAELLRYSNNKIFVRKLIADASGAVTKIRYESITSQRRSRHSHVCLLKLSSLLASAVFSSLYLMQVLMGPSYPSVQWLRGGDDGS